MTPPGGGGVTRETEVGKVVQVALASNDPDCPGTMQPSLTNIAEPGTWTFLGPHRDWIQETTKKGNAGIPSGQWGAVQGLLITPAR